MIPLPAYTSRDWALALHDHGYQVVHVPLRQKFPAIAWRQYQTARVPREQVETWWAHGEHNLAIITGAISNVVVVDGDSPEACDYIEFTCDPTPFRVKSSKGGHFYFRHPGDGKIPNSVKVMDDPPVDLRGDGGLIIGPGSVHPSGAMYRLMEGADIASPADLPVFRREWFALEAATVTEFRRPVIVFRGAEHQRAIEQARRYMAEVPGAVEGAGGDHFTYLQACRLVRGFDLSDDDALAILQVWNQKCTPPWSDAELAAKVRHARAYGTGEFGALLARARGMAAAGFLSFGCPR